jgi:hypothetical protein
MFRFENGDEVRDTVTGVQGVITGRYEYLNGCLRYTIEYAKDGEPKDMTLDEDRLELVKSVKREGLLAPTGGPRTAPPR